MTRRKLHQYTGNEGGPYVEDPEIQMDNTAVKIIPEDIQVYSKKIDEKPYQHPIISKGYKVVGRKDNNHRVNQKSVFGERKYKQNRSLADRAWNSFTDAVHLTSPPTFKDGYGRTLNAEVPLMESAQGQELRRMGKTAFDVIKIASIPFFGKSLYFNPFSTTVSAGVGAGTYALMGPVTDGINDQLHKQGKELSNDQKETLRILPSFFTGKLAHDYGTNVTKRGIEVAMHTTAYGDPIPEILSGWKQRNISQKLDVLKYIFTGKNNNGTSNTLGWRRGKPHFYTGFFRSSQGSVQDAPPEYGYDAIRAYLYKEPLYPFKQVKGKDYGILDTYVRDNYSNKDIKIFETKGAPYGEQVAPGEPKLLSVKPYHGTIETNIEGKGKFLFDAAGHNKEFGDYNGRTFIREQDIWKFNPKDFMKRWTDEFTPSPKKFVTKYGLDLVDYHGTPFIVRTPWYQN